MFSIGDDFWVTDEQKDRVFLVDGKAMTLRETLELKDTSGAVAATVRKKMFAMRDTMQVERADDVIATVTKAMFSPLRHRSGIDLADGSRWEASGDLIGLDYTIEASDRTVARVSRSWFRVRDTYGVETGPGEDDALILAVAVCLDRIHRDEEIRDR
jgi:uncharacterized protein YxjI